MIDATFQTESTSTETEVPRKRRKSEDIIGIRPGTNQNLLAQTSCKCVLNVLMSNEPLSKASILDLLFFLFPIPSTLISLPFFLLNHFHDDYIFFHSQSTSKKNLSRKNGPYSGRRRKKLPKKWMVIPISS